MRNRIDKKLFAILLGYVAAYQLVYLSRRVILKFMGEPGYVDNDWLSIIFGPILCSFIIIPPIILLILFFTKKMIELNLNWASSLGMHFIFSIVYAFLVIYLNTIYNYFVYGDPLELFSKVAIVNILYGSTLNFLAYGGFVSIIYSYYYFQRTAAHETQKVLLAKQLQTMKMEVLKSQLNPHFLFNTLNTISSLIKEDAHKAQHLIGNLGDLLREVLLVKEENMIPVSKEMIILKKYIEIMQIRFSDHLFVECVITTKAKDVLIPSMLLQPLVENSFEHGFSYDHTNLRVKISISTTEKWLIVQIQNNGASISLNGNDLGLGIRNVQERLETLYGDNFEFSLSNLNDQDGVISEIKIPLAAA